jgi:L-seryl-tRNA(Ser) seleniumtransferase
MTTEILLRRLPSVDALLAQADHLTAIYGRDAVKDATRAVLDATRRQILDGGSPPESLLDAIHAALEARFQPTLRPVINATGVIIHTNLGRAPLSDAAQQAMLDVARGYSTLEFDLETGKRGKRQRHIEAIITEVTGAEAAMVVNNNAAATVLMLSELAGGREVVVSRGELVEIGGGFRVPAIMAQSGAQLVEVGTTNRTRLSDFEAAIGEETALLMRVHASNFRQIGFTESAPLLDLADLAHRHGLHLVDDLGSGALIDTAPFGLDHEPTVQESLAAGCDVVAFSGDKLLGGPQSGILVGGRPLIDRLKRHPLARAFRADKLCIAALAATLDHYRRGEMLEAIPVLRMIARPLDSIQAQAAVWAQALGERASVVAGESTVGGGSLPGTTLPTALVALDVPSADRFVAYLRAAPTPIIARIVQDRVLLDPRTVAPEETKTLLHQVGETL